MTTTKKSQATITWAWLRTNVSQRWLGLGSRRGHSLRYLPTVRGDTRIPNFGFSSLAMCSCPQIGFSEHLTALLRRGLLSLCGSSVFQLPALGRQEEARFQQAEVSISALRLGDLDGQSKTVRQMGHSNRRVLDGVHFGSHLLQPFRELGQCFGVRPLKPKWSSDRPLDGRRGDVRDGPGLLVAGPRGRSGWRQLSSTLVVSQSSISNLKRLFAATVVV